MKHLIKGALALLFGLILVSCGQNQSQDSKSQSKDQPTERSKKAQELKHEPIEVEKLNLSLNDGKKWRVDTVTMLQVLKVEKKVEEYGRKLNELGGSSFKKLGGDIDAAIQKIKTDGKMKDPGKKELDKWLRHLKEEDRILKEGDKKKGQVALLNISKLIDVFHEHFEFEG